MAKKAMGPDDTSGQVLKECRKELIDPVYDIINYSTRTGAKWKRANVIPINKNGDRKEPLNHRLVSFTGVCKLC